MAARRQQLAQRRKALGYSQEALAEQLGADRSTVARWERGESEPQPFIRPKLGRLLQVTPAKLEALLKPDSSGEPVYASPGLVPLISGRAAHAPDLDAGDLDDMNRRELLRLLSVAGALVTLHQQDSTSDTRWAAALAAEADDIEQCKLLNAHLWQVFRLSPSKRLVYPLVRQQLSRLTESLDRAHSGTTHTQLCELAGDLFQLAGEICFDSNRYTDAAHCYTLAASACKEAGAYDLWACALTRHAFVGMYERRFAQASSILTVAARVATRGDSQLATRHWVAAVQAGAFAGLGDADSCNRALDAARQVRALNQPATNSGWLRFDGSRLTEERGTCCIELGRADLAQTALTEALNQPISLRRRGSILTDLATLGIQRHDLDQVLEYGDTAVKFAEQTQSAGYVGRKLQRLRTQLTPYAADDRVSQLTARISQLPIVT
jgi:transcriptional regulator with XRE-family HTH domain